MAAQTLMVLGAGVFQLPLIKTAQSMGLRVVALSNLPDDPGLKLADKGYTVSTLNKEEVLQIARHEKISGILTKASEIAAPTAAWVAGEMGLPGYPYQAALTIANKLLLRQFLQKHGLSRIRFANASTPEMAQVAARQLPFPLMLKPLLSSGSRGIQFIQKAEEILPHLQATVAESFVMKGALLEEFLEGPAIGGQLLICNGKIAVSAFSEKFINRHFVTTGHLLPAPFPEEVKDRILTLLQQVISHLGLQNGALDADLVLTSHGPEIIELGGRLGGNAIAELASRHTGTNYLQEAISLALGREITPANPAKIPVAVHITGSDKPGFLHRIRKFEELFPAHKHNLIRQNFFTEPGTAVRPYTQGNFQLGNLLLTAPTLPQLAELLSLVQKQTWAEVGEELKKQELSAGRNLPSQTG